MLITSKSEILCMLLPVFLCVAGRSTMYLLHGTENLQILHVKDVTIVYSVCFLCYLQYVYIFRFKHMMIRSNCESAAFYRCGRFEWKKANRKLKALTSLQQRLNVRQYVLNCTSCSLVYLLHSCFIVFFGCCLIGMYSVDVTAYARLDPRRTLKYL